MATEHRHRPSTGLKQSNKPFKSRHSSKSSQREKSKGKIQRVSITHAHKHYSSKADRRNTAKLHQIKKREELMLANRIFDGRNGAPRIVFILPLCKDVSAVEIARQLAQSIDEQGPDNDDFSGTFQLNCPRFHQKAQFVILPRISSFYGILDACRVADYVVLGLSGEEQVDEFGEGILRTIQQQGIGTIIPIVSNLELTPQAKRPAVRKSLSSFVKYFFPDDTKVHATDIQNEALNVVRSICTSHPKPQKWRDLHSYVVAESIEYEPNGSNGVLRVTGVVRGARLSANRLVHIQDHGDFQIEKITSTPNIIDRKATEMVIDECEKMDAQGEIVTLHVPNENQDPLVSEIDPDIMGNEQTWPTEEELAEASAQQQLNNRQAKSDNLPDAPMGTTPRRLKRVPKGTSDYQATWIIDNEEEDNNYSDDDDEDEDGDQNMMMNDEESEDSEEHEYIYEDTRGSGANPSESYLDMDEEEEKRELERYREERREKRKLKDELEFPDEVDTPVDIPARTRFQKYRGLQSFRTSPWDPYENLPKEYARIYQFDNSLRTKKKVFANALVEGVKPGTRVIVHIRDVPNTVAEKLPSPLKGEFFTLFSLLEHEHKTTVLNFSVTKNTEYEEPVRSKEDLIIQIGFRRLLANPIFSQYGSKSSNNVNKFERLFVNNTTMATIFGPVTWGQAPVLIFKEGKENAFPNFIGYGSMQNMDPTRIIAKRIILSGHPFKLHKKSATIRFMFFNREDVLYFKSVQLHTKYGRRGHILESLGTHGYFKATFDGQLNAQDTICMALYKRTYPKFARLYTKNILYSVEEEKKIVP